MAWPTLGRPRSLRFQVRTHRKRVCILALLRHAAGLSLSPNGIFLRLLQAVEPGVTESAELLGRLQLLCLLSGIKGIEELGGEGSSPSVQVVRPEAIVKTPKARSGSRGDQVEDTLAFCGACLYLCTW